MHRYPALKIPTSTGDDLDIMQLPVTTRHFSMSDLIIRNYPRPAQPMIPPACPSAPDVHLPSICVVSCFMLVHFCYQYCLPWAHVHFSSHAFTFHNTYQTQRHHSVHAQPAISQCTNPIADASHFSSCVQSTPISHECPHARMHGCTDTWTHGRMDAHTNSRLGGRWLAVRYWPSAASGWPCACRAPSWYAPRACPWVHTG